MVLALQTAIVRWPNEEPRACRSREIHTTCFLLLTWRNSFSWQLLWKVRVPCRLWFTWKTVYIHWLLRISRLVVLRTIDLTIFFQLASKRGPCCSWCRWKTLNIHWLIRISRVLVRKHLVLNECVVMRRVAWGWFVQTNNVVQNSGCPRVRPVGPECWVRLQFSNVWISKLSLWSGRL